MTPSRTWRAYIAGTFLSVVIAIIGYVLLPSDANIPIHWTDGEADRFTGRFEATVLFPSLLVALAAVLYVIDRIRIRRSEQLVMADLPAIGVIGMLLVVIGLQLGVIIGGVDTAP